MTEEETLELVKALIKKEKVTSADIVEKLCVGPQEFMVRRCIWQLLDTSSIYFDPDLKLVVRND